MRSHILIVLLGQCIIIIIRMLPASAVCLALFSSSQRFLGSSLSGLAAWRRACAKGPPAAHLARFGQF